MKGTKIFRKIKADRRFLLNAYLKDTALMCALIALIITLNLGIHSHLSTLSLLIIPFAVMNGLIIASLLHNTAHNNVKGSLLNRVIGEYCGYWVLYGYSNFVLIHFLHHTYSDEELDPVNPKGMSFFVFLTAPMRYMIKAAKKFLLMIHGHHEDYLSIMTAQTALFHLNLGLRLSIWYLILGKGLFLTFFVPGFISIVAVFAHINYVCHKELPNGEIEIRNLNHNLYYKIANFFTMGGYYHRNHHINMRLFDPREMKLKTPLQIQLHAVYRLQTDGRNGFRQILLRKI
jgi:fatty acid desaturase